MRRPGIEAFAGHLERIGGVLIRPRATLVRIAAGAGRLEELVWIGVVAVFAATPSSLGQILRLGRRSISEALFTALNTLWRGLSGPVTAVLIGAALLYLSERLLKTERSARDRLPLGRCVDVAAFCLLPFFLLAVLGVLYAASGGWLPSWVPHRILSSGVRSAGQGALAFSWSLGLLGLLIWTRAQARDGENERTGDG